MARAVLRNRVTAAAEQAQDEAGFFAQLREAGVLVRLRFSEINPGEVTGYAVTLPGHTGPDGAPRWYGGGRLADGLTLPRLRRYWNQDRTGTAPRAGSFRFTAPEREAFYRHAAQQAAAATEHIRRSAGSDPTAAADTAWAAAATFHATARAIRDPALRDAADTYDRAARMAYGKIPQRTNEGDRLRAAARLLAMADGPGDGRHAGAVHLTAAWSGWPRRSASCARPSSTPRRPLRRGRRPSSSTPASARRGQAPLAPDGPEQIPGCTEAGRRRQSRLPGHHGPGSLHAEPDNSLTGSRPPARARHPARRPAAPDHAGDRPPSPSYGGPKIRAAQCRPCSIHAA